MSEPSVIAGGEFSDARGKISYVNDFLLERVKRFYIIEHPSTEVVRAWQAHKYEEKWFYVIEGSFVVSWVKIDNWETPSADLKSEYRNLTSSKSEILHIPGGFANGFKALNPSSKLLIFSNFTTEESSGDIFRYDSRLWFNWNFV